MTLTVTSHEKTPGVFVITPVGGIYLNTSDILEKKVDQLLESAAKTMVFDMRDVDYVSSAGIRVILKAQKAMKKRDGNLMMVNFQPQVKKVFDIISALPSQQIFSSIEEMDAYLDHIQQQTLQE